MQAVSVAVLQDATKRYSNLPEQMRGELSDIELEYISPWIRQNEAAWQEFLAGSKKSYCYRPYTHNPNDKHGFIALQKVEYLLQIGTPFGMIIYS